METVVVRANLILPPAAFNIPGSYQPPEETDRRRQGHKANGAKPVFQFDDGCRSDQVLDMLDQAGLKLAEVTTLNVAMNNGRRILNRSVTILVFNRTGCYQPTVTLGPKMGETADELADRANQKFNKWLTTVLNRSWGGAQLWAHGPEVPLTLNLLNPEALDQRHEHVPLADHLRSSIAQSA